MKIAVVGLGLIGASLARSLKKFYYVSGYDRDKKVMDFAVQNEYINGAVENFSDFDFVIVAIPPRAAMEFLKNTEFKKGAIVTDVCGVKQSLKEAAALNENINYVGSHPMAGREVSGIKNSKSDLFNGASLIICIEEDTDINSAKQVREVLSKAGFSKIVNCSAEFHDRVIAYTSQLAHVVSSAYIKSPTVADYKGFTGGSFQDMTRIAKLDTDMWSELFLLNRDNLITEISTLLTELKKCRAALSSGDEETLKKQLSSEGIEL